MFSQTIKTEYTKPMLYFSIGFCVVLLAGWIPVFRGIDIFMAFWRVEAAASLFLILTLVYSFYKRSDKSLALCLSRREINFIVLPMLAFIGWSALSMFWSPSWKSAAYHTLVWAEYLIFYLVIRRVLEQARFYKLIITTLTAMLLIIALPAIIEYCSFIYLGGATTLGIRYSKYGEPVIALFPLITVGILRLNGRRFAFGVFTLAAMWLFVISTFGRTNFVLFICAAAGVAGLVFFLKRHRRYRRKMSIIILALVLAPVPVHLITLLGDKPNVPIVGRIQGEAKTVSGGNFRKLMTSVSLEMAAAHPVGGIGAGNFGIRFNDYRAVYADKNPTDVNLTTAENELAERSHNEFLQIFAELGATGVLIFLWFLSAVVVMLLVYFRRFGRASLFPPAALIGILLFLASSAVSSFSFRLMQNGLVFFFVLAVAAKFLLASESGESRINKITVSENSAKYLCLLSIVACLLMLAYCSIRVASAVYADRANYTPDAEKAARLYQTALSFDDENADAPLFYGSRLTKDGRYAEAVPYFRQSIALGEATSITYSYLATAQSLSGDRRGARETFAEAVRLYPLSPFVRARYAFLLQADGDREESLRQLTLALEIDKKQTNTWWSLFNRGFRQTTQSAYNNDEMVKVTDLTPWQAVYASLLENQIRFPAEKNEPDSIK